jgi:RimJ/RimL family protein N-acetyltransferase
VKIELSACDVRSWRIADVEALTAHANNPRIGTRLRDGFPHPYTTRHARTFIRRVREEHPETNFAIAVEGTAVGAIGFVLKPDIERVSAEIGYWLAERLWGQGIATEAVKAVTSYAVANHGLSRVFAVPFATNLASCRVLEKAGYTLEGTLRRSAIKDGVIVDQLQYAYVVESLG